MAQNSCVECNPMIEVILYRWQIRMYTVVSCMALIVYDHLHTLPMEIRYIWSSRRLTMVNVLYYITKYGMFFSAVDLYRTFNHSITVRECQYTAYIYSAFIVSSLWVGEAALGIRVWAISGKKRCLTIALPIIFCALFITYLVFLLDYLGSMEYGQAPAPQLIRCFMTKANKSIDVTLACLPAWVALMFILLTTYAYQAYKRGGNTRFSTSRNCFYPLDSCLFSTCGIGKPGDPPYSRTCTGE
ncbi:hypothetical protein JOM56_000437 [Amanita muscaria]